MKKICSQSFCWTDSLTAFNASHFINLKTSNPHCGSGGGGGGGARGCFHITIFRQKASNIWAKPLDFQQGRSYGGGPGGTYTCPPQILGAPRCPPPQKNHAYILFNLPISRACKYFAPHITIFRQKASNIWAKPLDFQQGRSYGGPGGTYTCPHKFWVPPVPPPPPPHKKIMHTYFLICQYRARVNTLHPTKIMLVMHS